MAPPRELKSSAGSLDVELTAARGRVRINGRYASMLCYNGMLPGPTLRLRAGDRLNLSLRNDLDEATNLHVHGLHVSPEGRGDNPFVRITPGSSFDYGYELPASHPPGVYWYHPHLHGTVADQVSGGLYGAIIVEDPEPIAASRERVLVVSDVSLDSAGSLRRPTAMERMMGRMGEVVLLNGQVRPRLEIRTGERERWRVVNTCVSRFLRLRLDGQRLQLLGVDSGRRPVPASVEEVLLPPGGRADLLVVTTAGTSRLRALPYDRMGAGGPGNMGGMMGGSDGGGHTLATVEAAGAGAPSPAPVPARQAQRDLRSATPAVHRELVFSAGFGGMMGRGPGGTGFAINGSEFNPDRTDVRAEAGTVEEWTLVNSSPMDHPIHLHVWPMQVVDSPRQVLDDPDWRDVVNVPANERVRVRVAFDDFVGRSVFHCHILDHEDSGMMAVIEVR
ncbi:multicopper oxidase family protein [Arthrobacter crystallopoietes BAB-32]|uniref:Multicopper oxidase family protein n=1 Tax=Arthrobacter crystallopoietes BAB-32 TaxID=1246476 RepID=N1V4Q9_9MICC|nr:multicopper oxidase family protein [Arthrobacter crystallopoietes BAB-32]